MDQFIEQSYCSWDWIKLFDWKCECWCDDIVWFIGWFVNSLIVQECKKKKNENHKKSFLKIQAWFWAVKSSFLR